MKAARLIVSEKTGRWAVALRRELAGSSVRIQQTRSLPECIEELTARRGSLLALEATWTNLAKVLDVLGQMQRRFPLARAVVLADRSLDNTKWLLREAGALHVTCSPRLLAPVARLAQRHLTAAPQEQLPVTERMMASLPWSRV